MTTLNRQGSKLQCIIKTNNSTFCSRDLSLGHVGNRWWD